jgi:hypothetical protein
MNEKKYKNNNRQFTLPSDLYYLFDDYCKEKGFSTRRKLASVVMTFLIGEGIPLDEQKDYGGWTNSLKQLLKEKQNLHPGVIDEEERKRLEQEKRWAENRRIRDEERKKQEDEKRIKEEMEMRSKEKPSDEVKEVGQVPKPITIEEDNETIGGIE